VPRLEGFRMQGQYTERKSIWDRYLLAKPSTRGGVEFVILLILGIVCTLLSHPQLLFPIGNILGVILIVIGSYFHGLSHKVHKQASEKSEKIEKLVATGIYSKIRHPGYLGLILLYFGIAFAWGFVALVVLVTVYACLWVETAKKEEKYLMKKFGDEYKKYMRKVPWRFIPRVV